MKRIEDHGLVYYQFVGLQAETGVRHACFTRLGGVSALPYATLNVGASVGDDPAAVSENRERCFTALGVSGGMVVSPHQVHSTTVARVGAGDAGSTIPGTDGLVTAERGLLLLLRFADCVPIVLYDRQRGAIGLVHAGWKGTLEGMAAAGVAAMETHFGSRPGELWAGIGPAIGPCCYEVGADMAASFAGLFGPQVASEARMGHAHLDLALANAIALQRAGVGEVEGAGLCTSCHVDEFFSHRREGGRTGRLAVLAGLFDA